MKKGILLWFMLFMSMGSLFAQSLNDKITAKIERYVEYREGGYHDALHSLYQLQRISLYECMPSVYIKRATIQSLIILKNIPSDYNMDGI